MWGYFFAIVGGEGKPFRTLTKSEIRWFFACYYFPEIGYCVHITLIKFSILVSYKRIFGHITWCRHAIRILFLLCSSWFIGCLFPFVFQCRPIKKAFKPWIPGSCFDLEPWLWGNGIANNILDILILLLPIWPILRMRTLERAQKVLVMASFSMGSLACVASGLRVYSTFSLDYNDFSAGVFLASISTYAEPMLAIISACLPFLPIGHCILEFCLAVRRRFEARRLTKGAEATIPKIPCIVAEPHDSSPSQQTLTTQEVIWSNGHGTH
ncbi:hypothetical protein CC78DRAFT_544857 [Lojkania enalia]|uniref:Rhodopsin domain-containing protein n=1 Tax=Lojkania enalia TaxID=147567 RepID=A0A9P4K9M7_9PLEO|nr:hypothetical protein CC78DRAFT_544857 [Didymosphaeria enalia]